jgi:UDP-N-acetylmuramoyl-L-alanyl-D-glutamate--2,6-diaminopimelate ligase
LLDGLEAEWVDCSGADTILALTADSRQVAPGTAFVALAGVRGDGHAYIESAIEKGAAIIVAQRGSAPSPSTPHVWLKNSAAALPILAANFHGWPDRTLTTYGLTGTNGKTTCSYLLGSILEAAQLRYARLGTTGNLLVDIEVKGAFTTPFPIELQGLLAQARTRGASHAVMEVSSHALAQGRARPIEFNAVAMTSFSQDHLDYHADMDDYLEAKLRLCDEHLARDGFAVAAVDDNPAASNFLERAAAVGARPLRLSRGGDPSAEYLASPIDFDARGTHLRLTHPRGELEWHSPLLGAFNVDNMMVAAALALESGLSEDAVRAGLSRSIGAPGRLELVQVRGIEGPRVYVDYAHTPDAVGRALEVLRRDTRGRLIVLLGCGGDRDRAKRPLMGAAAERASDVFWASSDNPRTEDPAAIVDEMIAGLPKGPHLRREVDRARAIKAAIAEACPEDVILIAGKGHEAVQLVGDQKIEFDDREHARRALADRAGLAPPQTR